MLGTALIVAILAGFITIEYIAFGQFGFSNPLVSASLVGLVLGDLQTGITVGITLQLIWMGIVGIGAAVPPDVVTGAILASAFAILTGEGAEIALAIAVPVAIAAQTLDIFVRTLQTGLIHWADRLTERGNYKAIERVHLLGLPITFLRSFIVVFPAIYFGVDSVKAFISTIPQVVIHGLEVAGGMLPALGFGMLLNMIGASFLLPYFFIGFALATFLDVSLIGVAVIGASAAFLHDYFCRRSMDYDEVDTPQAEAEDYQRILTRQDLLTLFRRTFLLQTSWNFERMQALGYCYIVLPVLRKLYKDNPDGLQAAVKRNLEFFNTQPYMASAIIGTAVAAEERLAIREDIEPGSISAIKLATMGPFAGIGDSLFWMTIRPICLGIGIAVAEGGNILGPILFLILFNIFHIWTRYVPLVEGYKLGTNFLTAVQSKGILQRITEAASVLGLMVLGVMVATMVNFNTTLVLNIGQSQVALQEVLDQILPNMLPLALTFVCFKLLSRGKAATKILFGILVFGILGSLIGLF
jgi:PTS system mannose-specific IID component